MKTYLINLDRDTERLAHVRARLDSFKIPFERFPAVNGKETGDTFLVEFAAARPKKNGKGWGAGQIGCFLSHYYVWEKVAKGSDEYALILEDDGYLSSELPAFVKNLDWIPEDADIVRLEVPTCAVKTRLAKQVGQRKLYRILSTSWCAGAYIINRSCAQRLLNLPPAKHMPTDRMLFCFEDSEIARSLNIYQIAPALSIQDKFTHEDVSSIRFESNIEGPGSGGKKIEMGGVAFIKSIIKVLLGYKDISYQD
jgi:glycosyl transferase family 25